MRKINTVGMQSAAVRAVAFAVAALWFVACGAGPQAVEEPDPVREVAERAMARMDRTMTCWRGATPVFDGQVSAEEYSDAAEFTWGPDWIEAMQLKIESREDLDFRGWVKHDGRHLYMAFDVTDDLLYGIHTDRWVPDRAPEAHVLGERTAGWPWFGDMIEVLVYGRMLDLGEPVSDVTGDGRGIQIIYNLTKSLEGGIGVPGMLPHGPNRSVENWENNKRWILDDVIESRTAIFADERRYTVEIRILLDGGIEIGAGQYWSPEHADTPIGFNLAVGDVDSPDKSPDGLLHHETWWAGKTTDRSDGGRVKFWGVLWLTASERSQARTAANLTLVGRAARGQSASLRP